MQINNPANTYTVSQITSYISDMFTRDFVLGRISVKGEVSNCKYHSSGHIYFTLKDRDAQIGCIMFSSERAGLTFRMEDGQMLEVSGRISVYEKTGSYRLIARAARLSGAGELYEEYLRLKASLSSMGMFDELYKKPIPRYAMRIGVVTAATGAAIKDIINVSRRRNPYVSITLCPAKVQGEGAAESIARGIERLDAMGLDVIIAGRGGGSIEDLWAFNEERVIYAIFNASTPIISAVGHETDFTIADFVADMRAPTPSAAAELANFVYDDFEDELRAYHEGLKTALTRKLEMLKAKRDMQAERLKNVSPGRVYELKRLRIKALKDRLLGDAEMMSEIIDRRLSLLKLRLTNAAEKKKVSGRGRLNELKLKLNDAAERKTDAGRRRAEDLDRGLMDAFNRRLNASQNRLRLSAARLDGLSPLKRISGGFGYLTDSGGRALRSIEQVKCGDSITAYVSDGRISAEVKDCSPV